MTEDDLRGHIVTRQEALRAGYTGKEQRTLLASGEWQRLRRGVYSRPPIRLDATPAEVVRRSAMAIARTRRSPVAVSHRSAALLHGLHLFGGDTLLHVTVQPESPVRRVSGARVHRSRLGESHVTVLGGVLVTTMARTVVDVARTGSFVAGLVTADSALHSGLSRLDLLEVALACRSLRGGRRAERVAAFADGLAEAPSESLLRAVCHEANVPALQLQVWLHDQDGPIGRVDALVTGHRVVLEVDGKVKYDSRGVLWQEKRREDRLREAGYEVVRLSWDDLLAQPERSVARIRTACVRAGRRAA